MALRKRAARAFAGSDSAVAAISAGVLLEVGFLGFPAVCGSGIVVAKVGQEQELLEFCLGNVGVLDEYWAVFGIGAIGVGWW